VTPLGTYKTSVAIPAPPGPGAPSISLEYNSAAGLGLAGVGWDLSVGWPTVIVRDIRFGMPAWGYDSAWLWGDAPLVSTDANGCGAQTGVCSYRVAPDALATIHIDLRSSTTATVTLVSGVVLTYEPVRYDGTTYPAASLGAETDVFAFLLRSVKTPNGYLTCFKNKHWGDTVSGRVAVLEEITYGASLKDCAAPPSANQFHKVTFEYIDPTSLGDAYFAPVSYRFGAPVAFNNLLTAVSIFAADFSASATVPTHQATYRLDYEPASAPETRLPRLAAVTQETPPPVSLTRTLRQFR
jgi:hypothetical protein